MLKEVPRGLFDFNIAGFVQNKIAFSEMREYVHGLTVISSKGSEIAQGNCYGIGKYQKKVQYFEILRMCSQCLS